MNSERVDDYLDKLDKEDEEVDTINIRFEWKSVMPDLRQWKPSSPIFEPAAIVEIPVPSTPEYFIFGEEKPKKLFDEAGTLIPVLTLKGMRYCIDKLEDTMSDKPASDNEDDLWDEDDWSGDEWGNQDG